MHEGESSAEKGALSPASRLIPPILLRSCGVGHVVLRKEQSTKGTFVPKVSYSSFLHDVRVQLATTDGHALTDMPFRRLSELWSIDGNNNSFA